MSVSVVSSLRDVTHGKYATVQFSSVQGDMYALGKDHMRSISPLRIFTSVAFETVQMLV